MRLLLGLLFLLAIEDAEAYGGCYFCTGQQQIIGYAPYSYLTPRVTYQMNYGYRPIYGNNFFGRYGLQGMPHGANPYYRQYSNPYVQIGTRGRYLGFRNRYTPRSSRVSSISSRRSSRSRGSDRTTSPRRPTTRPAPAPTSAPQPAPAPAADCPESVREAGFLISKSEEKAALCRRSGGEPLAGYGSDSLARCIFRWPVVKNEAGECVPQRICPDENDYVHVDEKGRFTCRAEEEPPLFSSEFEDPCGEKPEDVDSQEFRDWTNCNVRQRDGQSTPNTPAQTFPLGPPASVGPVIDMMCRGEGEIYDREIDQCICSDGLTHDKGGVNCIPLDIEGEAPDVCVEGGCNDPAPTTPSTDIADLLCRDTNLGIEFDCECKDSSRIFQRNQAVELDITYGNADRNLNGVCIHSYMNRGRDIRRFVDCTAGRPDQVTEPYCLDRNYFQATWKSFNDAAECMLEPQEQLTAINFFGHESRFHVDALHIREPNPNVAGDRGDYSVGAGQLTFQDRGSLQDFIVNKNRFKNFVKGKSCEGAVSQALDGLSNSNRVNRNYCMITGTEDNPEISMYLSVLFFKYYKEREIKRSLENGFTCSDGTVMNESRFNLSEDDMEVVYNQLTAIRYNAGFGKVKSTLCGLYRIKTGAEGDAGALGMINGRQFSVSDFRVSDPDSGLSGYADQGGHPYIKKVIQDSLNIAPACRGDI